MSPSLAAATGKKTNWKGQGAGKSFTTATPERPSKSFARKGASSASHHPSAYNRPAAKSGRSFSPSRGISATAQAQRVKPFSRPAKSSPGKPKANSVKTPGFSPTRKANGRSQAGTVSGPRASGAPFFPAFGYTPGVPAGREPSRSTPVFTPPAAPRNSEPPVMDVEGEATDGASSPIGSLRPTPEIAEAIREVMDTVELEPGQRRDLAQLAMDSARDQLPDVPADILVREVLSPEQQDALDVEERARDNWWRITVTRMIARTPVETATGSIGGTGYQPDDESEGSIGGTGRETGRQFGATAPEGSIGGTGYQDEAEGSIGGTGRDTGRQFGATAPDGSIGGTGYQDEAEGAIGGTGRETERLFGSTDATGSIGGTGRTVDEEEAIGSIGGTGREIAPERRARSGSSDDDSDGDGVADEIEIDENTDPTDPCDFNSASVTLPVTRRCSGPDHGHGPSSAKPRP